MNFSKEKAKSSAIALAFIIICFSYFQNNQNLLVYAIGITALYLICPIVLYILFIPLHYIVFWLIGPFLSKAILLITFILIITPLGYLRRIMGNDPLQLKKWKQDNTSFFREYNKQFKPDDLKKPY